jgi:hypothetical protein
MNVSMYLPYRLHLQADVKMVNCVRLAILEMAVKTCRPACEHPWLITGIRFRIYASVIGIFCVTYVAPGSLGFRTAWAEVINVPMISRVSCKQPCTVHAIPTFRVKILLEVAKLFDWLY